MIVLEAGRGRLLLNRVRNEGALSLDVDGAGMTLFLNREQMLHLAGELIAVARGIRKVGP